MIQKRFNSTLLPHQVDPFNQMHTRKKVLLSSKAGSGKTIISLASWFSLYSAGVVNKLFVVMPVNAYSKKVWQKEIKKHMSGVSFITFEEVSHYTLPQLLNLHHDVILFKYTSVKFQDYQMYQLVNSLFLNAPAGKMNVVLFDEVHKCKTWDAQTTRIWTACKKNCPIVWGVTATNYSKDYVDTYHILNFVKPYVLGTFEDFKRQCCVVEEYFQPGAGYLDRITGIYPNVFFGKLNGMLILGDSLVVPQFHFYKYSMSPYTKDLYLRVASGLAVMPVVTASDEVDHKDTLRRLLSTDIQGPDLFTVRDGMGEDVEVYKDISKNSAGYVYLQYVADGAVNADGEFKPTDTTKLSNLINTLADIYKRNRSCVIFAHYYYSLDVVMAACKQAFPDAVLLENSSRKRLGENELNPEFVKKKTHFIFITQAGSESLSWGFISDLYFFNIPTTPSLFSQVAGRILRVDSIFLNDLHIHIPISNNIDGYKLLVVSAKSSQAEVVQGKDLSIPNTFKKVDFSNSSWERWKSHLLWGASDSSSILDI